MAMRLAGVFLPAGLTVPTVSGWRKGDSSEPVVDPGDTPPGPGLFTGRREAIAIGGGGGRTIRTR